MKHQLQTQNHPAVPVPPGPGQNRGLKTHRSSATDRHTHQVLQTHTPTAAARTLRRTRHVPSEPLQNPLLENMGTADGTSDFWLPEVRGHFPTGWRRRPRLTWRGTWNRGSREQRFWFTVSCQRDPPTAPLKVPRAPPTNRPEPRSRSARRRPVPAGKQTCGASGLLNGDCSSEFSLSDESSWRCWANFLLSASAIRAAGSLSAAGPPLLRLLLTGVPPGDLQRDGGQSAVTQRITGHRPVRLRPLPTSPLNAAELDLSP